MARVHWLDVLGILNAEPGDPVPAGTRSIVLLGPTRRGFWDHLTAQPEWQDGRADPVDRWSRRTIGDIARGLGATALFPFGGPPHAPFFSWALRSGQAWVSPVQFLVHDEAGLLVSFRGALALSALLNQPPATRPPCDSCADKPCLHACPADAIHRGQYRLAACHDHLSSKAGQTCMNHGCALRNACPLSRNVARPDAQSAHHMKAFHP